MKVLGLAALLLLSGLLRAQTWTQGNWQPTVNLTWKPLAQLSWQPMNLCVWLTPQLIPRSATLSWTDSDVGATFNVYRDGVLIQSGLSAFTWTDTGVSPGTVYSYTVSATVSGVESVQSTAVQVTIPTP